MRQFIRKIKYYFMIHKYKTKYTIQCSKCKNYECKISKFRWTTNWKTYVKLCVMEGSPIEFYCCTCLNIISTKQRIAQRDIDRRNYKRKKELGWTCEYYYTPESGAEQLTSKSVYDEHMRVGLIQYVRVKMTPPRRTKIWKSPI